MPEHLELILLGTPRLIGAAGPIPLSPGTSLLCAYLALAPKDGQRRHVAATQLFADCPEPVARRRLSTALWRLRTEVRSATGLDLVKCTRDDRMRLSPTVEMALDTQDFECLVAPALEAPPEALTPEVAARLERAVSLHRGQLIEECGDEWVLAERTRIETMYLTALDYLVVHHGKRGAHLEVRRYGELALAIEPLREDVHRHLMTAYAAAGRDDLVERQFERCRQVLLDELGADPLPETIGLYARLRHCDSGLSPSLSALRADLERARREVDRLAVVVDRALEHLRQLG
ncbi:BTAD domain-containing putative transcriptional regulator [Nocardioides sp.]|uniref:AfsR/SARP family transcriptional regulator n=1 Tax=Nocardioides sp. TaxID=35761 RepID=UPI0035AF19DC